MDVGVGLFNREMVRTIKGLWHDGGIGVVYVSSKLAYADLQIVIQQWKSDEPNLFWQQQLEYEYFFLFHNQQSDEPIARFISAVSERLKDRLQHVIREHKEQSNMKDKACETCIGTAVASLSVTGRSETVIYRMLLEAVEQSANQEVNVRNCQSSMETNHLLKADKMESRANPNVKQPSNKRSLQANTITIGMLAVPFPIFPPNARVSEVALLFDTNAKAQGAVIVDQGRPIGILMKEKLHQMLAGQFGLPLYWNRPVERIMNKHPLIVDELFPVEQVSQLAMAREFSQLYDVVLITKDGQMAGAASIRSILESITALRTEAARGANPLTGLPGNEEIQHELQRRIALGNPFAVIYADLDYFKWYNDYFGFGLGDELIRYLAELLRKELDQLQCENDFIGHVGGDDFITVMSVNSAEKYCQTLIERFDNEIKAFYGGVEVTAIEDRHGNSIEQDGVSLSLSLMIWDGEVPLTPEYISMHAAKLKKLAKARKGSAYVIDQISGSHLGEERRRT